MSSATATAPSTPEYLIDTILPAREIHLLAGPSGAGKTKWLLSMLQDWQRGAPVMKYPSHPVPWAYAACDRSREGFERTMESFGIRSRDIPFIPAWDERMTISQILDHAQRLKTRLLVIEAFGSFVDPPANNKCVKNFLQPFHAMIRAAGMTIIGIMESPKQKMNEGYENPRQRVAGVAAWAHFTETVFLVEFLNPRDAGDIYRKLTVCPRNAQGFEMLGQFDLNGRLHFTRKLVNGQAEEVSTVN